MYVWRQPRGQIHSGGEGGGTLENCTSVFLVLSRVHNILSPLRHDRKPLIFQWAFTLRNAGIGSVSNPAFYTLKNEWLPVVTKRRRYIVNPALPFSVSMNVCRLRS